MSLSSWVDRLQEYLPAVSRFMLHYWPLAVEWWPLLLLAMALASLRVAFGRLKGPWI